MTPGILMILGAVSLFIGLGLGIHNFVGIFSVSEKMTAKEALARADGLSEDEALVKTFSGTMKGFLLTHVVAGLFTSGGFLSLLGGFVWFLVERSG